MDNKNRYGAPEGADNMDMSVDSILAEFKADELTADNEGRAARSEHSHQIMMEDVEGGVASAAFRSEPAAAEDFSFLRDEALFGRDGVDAGQLRFEEPAPTADRTEEPDRGAETSARGDDAPELLRVGDSGPLPQGDALMELFADAEAQPEKAAAREPEFVFGTAAEDGGEPEPETAEVWEDSPDRELSDAEYAAAAEYEEAEPVKRERAQRKPGFKEKVVAPIIGLIAMSDVRRREKAKAERVRLEREKTELPPEMKPERAAAAYAAQADSVKPRAIAATALCIVLMWLSYGGPAFGALGSSLPVRSMVCLIMELTVMLLGLDVFTKGILTLFRKRPGGETLIAVSCIVSAVDAAILAITGNDTWGLPFCAVSAMSLTFALWGGYLQCKGFAISMLVAGSAKDPSVIFSQPGTDAEGCALFRKKAPVTGFVRRCEGSDVFEDVFRLFTPFLLAACLILSALCAVCIENNSFFHILAALTTICASFTAVAGFAFPFSVIAKRLARSGAAIAGYSGCAELGRVNRVIITDSDLFPPRTISIADIFLAEGELPDRVIAYTGSMIAAAGLGTAPAFIELMRKNACTMQRVEDFACHEGGGIVARINGDQVYVGSSGYMKLMGIRLPKKLGSSTAVYTAINDSLAGCFSVNYVPVSSVQRALVTLLRGKTEPLFAIRDFNITPMLIKQKFRLPGRSYDFPSFADRYRISSESASEDAEVTSMFSRGGLNAVSGLTSRGRKLYLGLRICAALAVLGSLIGVVMMFFMCWGDAYLSASVGNSMSYMLLWLAPSAIISLGLRR